MLRRLLLLAVSALAAGAALRRPAVPGPHDEPLPPARNEPSDVRFRPMLFAGVLMVVALGGVLAVAALLFPIGHQDNRLPPDPRQLPAPQLQASPPADMARFRAEQLKQLNTAYWLDHEHGRVHIPIAQAMQDVARQGIPDWPTK